MLKFTTLVSHVIPLPVEDLDTDQIIPARFMKGIDKRDLGKHLFADWRFLPDGSPNPDFILNHPNAQGAQILLVGDNFGCGSSREHAAWALLDWGFRAIISSSFADIFRNNALKNGLLPVTVPAEILQNLILLVEKEPLAQLTIDLETERLVLQDGGTVQFPIDVFSKRCLLEGVDPLDYLLSLEEQINTYEVEHDPI